jgi:micrococcal nuclease
MPMPRTRLAFLVVTAAFAAGCGAEIDITAEPEDAAAGSRSVREGVVTRVVDGDTFRMGDERVRLIGVDTPETKKPGSPVECFGKKASAFTTKMLDQEEVVLTLDVEERDRYGRTLAYVKRKRDGFDINRELIKRGYALPLTIPPNVKHADAYRELGAKARDRGRGLWSACKS